MLRSGARAGYAIGPACRPPSNNRMDSQFRGRRGDVPVRLISAPWVLPITQPPIRDGAVVVDDNDVIVAVGRRADVAPEYAGANEERASGALLPALVNAHCHL